MSALSRLGEILEDVADELEERGGFDEYIGDKLNGIANDLRGEVQYARERLKEFEDAWKEWDLDWLQRAGYLTRRDVKELEQEMEKQ